MCRRQGAAPRRLRLSLKALGASANGLYEDLDLVDLAKESTAQEKLRTVALTRRLANRAHADAGAAVAGTVTRARPDLGYGLLSSSSSAATSTRSSSRTGRCGAWSCSRASTSTRAASRRKLRRTLRTAAKSCP